MLRESLLELADSFVSSQGWHLEDIFEKWTHKQWWRKPLPLHAFGLGTLKQGSSRSHEVQIAVHQIPRAKGHPDRSASSTRDPGSDVRARHASSSYRNVSGRMAETYIYIAMKSLQDLQQFWDMNPDLEEELKSHFPNFCAGRCVPWRLYGDGADASSGIMARSISGGFR